MSKDEKYLLKLVRTARHPEQATTRVLQRAAILLQEPSQNEDDRRMLSMLDRATDKDAFISALEESAREYLTRPPVNPASKGQ